MPDSSQHGLLTRLGLAFGDSLRLVTFRATSDEMASYSWPHLVAGLLLAWVAGIGRTWDDTTVELLRRSGIGSVAYVPLLSLFLWAFARRFMVRRVGYLGFCAFVALVSPPAFLYAIPIERWMDKSHAADANAILLLVVATWRVALLIRFYNRGLGMKLSRALVSGFTPLSMIVAVVGAFGILYAIANSMGGMRSENQTLMTIIVYIGCFAMVVAPVLLTLYFTMPVTDDQ